MPEARRASVTELFRQSIVSEVPNRIRAVGDARITSERCCQLGDAAIDNLSIVGRRTNAPEGPAIATGCPIGDTTTSLTLAETVRSMFTATDYALSTGEFLRDRYESGSDSLERSFVTNDTATITV